MMFQIVFLSTFPFPHHTSSFFSEVKKQVLFCFFFSFFFIPLSNWFWPEPQRGGKHLAYMVGYCMLRVL